MKIRDYDGLVLEDAFKASTEPWFVENIYSKLNSKVKDYLKR